MRPTASRATLAALVALLPLALPAQVVRGRTVDAAGAPLASSVVVLVDSAGRTAGGALSDDAGHFTLAAPRAGRWRVRAERVGQAGALSAPLALAVGDTAHVTLTLGPTRRLATVRVNARERCRVRPEEGSRAAELWEGVRQALQGATLTMDTRRIPFSLERIERTRDRGGRVLLGETRVVDPTSAALFESAPPEELQRRGWVRTALDTVGVLDFFGPDARALVSDAFVEAHCMRAVDAPPARAGQVGLAFEPVRRGRDAVPDIRGTLWLDGATGELRELEFAYVGLASMLQRHAPGGRVGFGRLSSGTWFVDSWEMRMPAYEQQGFDSHYAHVGTREVGGRTLLEGDLPEVPPDVALLSGMVVDSTQDHAPVIGARVEVEGTGYATVTNVYGAFRLELPAHDSVRLRVLHPRLVALGVPVRRAVPVALGRESVATVGLPSVATVRRALCGSAADSAHALVTGAFWDVRQVGDRVVVDHSRPMRGAMLTVAWPREGGSDWSLGMAIESRQVATDDRGHFHLCGVPAGTRVQLRGPGSWWMTVQPFGAVVLELARGADWLRQQPLLDDAPGTRLPGLGVPARRPFVAGTR